MKLDKQTLTQFRQYMHQFNEKIDNSKAWAGISLGYETLLLASCVSFFFLPITFLGLLAPMPFIATAIAAGRLFNLAATAKRNGNVLTKSEMETEGWLLQKLKLPKLLGTRPVRALVEAAATVSGLGLLLGAFLIVLNPTVPFALAVSVYALTGLNTGLSAMYFCDNASSFVKDQIKDMIALIKDEKGKSFKTGSAATEATPVMEAPASALSTASSEKPFNAAARNDNSTPSAADSTPAPTGTEGPKA